MLHKQQLVSLLLKNQRAYHKEPLEQSFREYERNKEELVGQLLKQYHKTQMPTVIKTNKDVYHSKQIYRIQPSKQEANQVAPIFRLGSEQKEEQQDICKQILLSQYFSRKSKQQFYNDYMRQINQQQPDSTDQAKKEVQDRVELVNEGPSIIEKFLKRQNIIDRARYQDELQGNRPPEQQTYLKAQNKSYNQSTLALSKVTRLAKNGPSSPTRSFRVTQKIQTSISKSSEKEPSLSKHKVSPGRLSLSKISEIEIKVAPYGSIKHNVKKKQCTATPKSTLNRLEYSRSNLRQSSGMIDLKPFSTLKHVQTENIAVFEEFPTKEELQKDLEGAGYKRPKIEIKKPHQIDLISRIKLDLSSEKEPSESKVQSYDYDKEKNLFDQEATQINKRPIIKNEKPKISWNNVKDLWHIKDDHKFKSQIKNQAQIYQERHFKELPPKKQIKQSQKKADQKQSISHQSKGVQMSKKQQIDLEELQNYQEIDEEQKSFHFFDFLKDKLTSLTKRQSQGDASKLKITKKKQKQVEKHPKEPHNSDEASMDAQASEHQSSSSFVKQTKTIAEKGFRNVDLKGIVGQSVKRVSVNLEKIAAKNKEKSSSQISKQAKTNEMLEHNPLSEKSSKSKISKESKSGLDNQPSFSRNISLSKQAEAQRKEQSSIIGSKIIPSPKIKKQLSSRQLQGFQTKMEPFRQLEKPANLSVDFFAKCQYSSQKNGSQYSKPSTVQKIDSQSGDKSDLLHQLNFQDHKDDSLAQKLFEQNDLLQQPNKQTDSLLQIKAQSAKKLPECKEISQSSQLQLSYQTSIIKKPQRIDINLNDLQQISLSEDAISFSKLQDASDFELSEKQKVQQQKRPPQVKSQVKDQSIKSIPKQSETSKQAPRHLGKVKRIEINLEESSSGQQLADESDEKESYDINLDEINDYDSDEEGLIAPNTILGHQKQRNPTVLPPVVEEDLEESEFHKINTYKPSVSFQKQSEHQKQKDESMWQLQEEFLKDFPLNKVESDVQKYSAPINVKKVSSVKEGRQKIKIKIKPTDSKFTNIQSDRQANESIILDEASKDEKLLLEDIKGDIQKLKNKIESSAMLDISKRQQAKQLTNAARKGDIDMSSNKSNGNRSILNSLSRIEKDRSFTVSQKKESKSISSKGNNKSINFDQINETNGRQLFESFREDLNSLKKKIQSDALQGY